jgi:hypothetical protein
LADESFAGEDDEHNRRHQAEAEVPVEQAAAADDVDREPRLSPPLPRRAAMTETANSGIEVPKPTTVSPTTIGEMPSLRAMREAPSTSHDPPSPRHKMPAVTRSQGRRASKVIAVGILASFAVRVFPALSSTNSKF